MPIGPAEQLAGGSFCKVLSSDVILLVVIIFLYIFFKSHFLYCFILTFDEFPFTFLSIFCLLLPVFFLHVKFVQG